MRLTFLHVTTRDATSFEHGLVFGQLVQLLLLCVQVVEEDPEDHSGDGAGDADANVKPHDCGIANDRNESLADGIAKSVSEQVQALDKGFHARGSFRVGVLELQNRMSVMVNDVLVNNSTYASNGDEDLR